MGRKRTKSNLPRRMHQRGPSYYYVRTIDGKLKWTRLADNYPEAFEAWCRLEGLQDRPAKGTTVGEALDRYLVEVLPKKAETTRREYLRYGDTLRAVFGDVPVEYVVPADISGYLDCHRSLHLANREVSMLSGIFREAMRWGWAAFNPCSGVRRHRETPRDRYVTDEEIASLGQACGPQMLCIVDLVLLTALRKKDVLAIKLSDIQPDGLHVHVSKSGVHQVFPLRGEFQEVIQRARSLRRRVGSMYLFANRKGRPYTTSGFDSNWKRMKKEAGVDFAFHDLRARAISDADEIGGTKYAQELAGHQEERTTRRYIRHRKPRQVEPLQRKLGVASDGRF